MKSHNVYREIEISSEVLGASKHRQIQLLFEKCLEQMRTAKQAMVNKEYANKHLAIGKATEILNYLRLCLNFKDSQTAAMAKQLDDLYALVSKSLISANLKNDPEFIDQAYQTLMLVKEGWDGIG